MSKDTEPKKAAAKPEGELTPSGLALAEVGEPKEGATDEDLNEHAAKYQAAKLKARRG